MSYASDASAQKAPLYILFLLILAGEAVFILPFVLARVFRPTVLEVFQVDNLQLGLCFSVYGVVAMLSYLFGGPLADRYSSRKLIAIALWLTAIGGILFATFPQLLVLQILYGYWGFTTIFLFWAPMIKATRLWGGNNSQGKAFGFLEGGRGLVGALFGSIGLLVFSFVISNDEYQGLDLSTNRAAFRQVILVCAGMVAFVGLLVWRFMRLDNYAAKEIVIDKISYDQIKQVLRLPSVWLLMIIILCAYVGYKITDLFSLYANDVMQYDPVQSAQVGTVLLYMRPVLGVIIGLLADRTQSTIMLILGFVLAIIGAILFATGSIISSAPLLFIVSTLIVATGVYATRSLYFAIMKKGQIPLYLTGTAVGLASLLGYTPDVFVGPVTGYMLENAPGIKGHQHAFWFLGCFSMIGLIASVVFHRYYNRIES
ncbi:MFS transporter [Carboxylicivirga marina]|uniref:MFS transporter n=1 Tax=Carboxylicivirga marina TaxID=2800988 RepID=UPI0025960C47|nr:MFS transporter [uncultured Carboxylicivirga sp.]